MHLLIIGHRCSRNGCGEVFVPDGNMKKYRDVCFAKEAGYVEYEGLPGKIGTGCSKHNPTVVLPEQEGCSLDKAVPVQSEEQQGIIIGKKTTRQSTVYEVEVPTSGFIAEPSSMPYTCSTFYKSNVVPTSYLGA